MKALFTIYLALIFFSSSAQTKILDSKLTSNKLIVYCSDSLAVSISVQIGTSYQTSNMLNASYTIGTDLTFVDNDLTIPLSSIATGDYFVTVTITRSDNSTQQMEYETSL